ncbi:hypothetical protein L9F63_024571 [Diploptera punctata]|uniref:uS12 prolyl 3-hydroxylase n=1 Tax=Diploptera punctata TaxID=6984 RepID=A0AAD7ZER1_DIPPU|nr:hypothetical protein L9F63_024571 [Diploptera punctata]
MNNKRKALTEESEVVPVKLKYHRTDFLSENLKKIIGILNRSWCNDEPLNTDDVTVSSYPFRHCVIRNFIQDKEYLKCLKEEVCGFQFSRKHNDLYQYYQSADFSTIDKTYVNKMKRFLKEECRAFLQSVTGIVLNKKISSACSSYSFTDHLLCHDDKCEDRRVAFILYLNEGWLPENGGALELFSSTEDGDPDEVVSALQPIYNSFVFFEVTNNSFHQVAEVTSRESARLSINGWFHGTVPSDIVPNVIVPLERPLYAPMHVTTSLISHINRLYMDPDIQTQITENFERDSEILLPDFFDIPFYRQICKSLRAESLIWTTNGPANRRKYEVLHEENLPSLLHHVIQFFKSEEFFQFLSALTKLDLEPDEDDMPMCSYQVERWKKGFYTLLHDVEKKKTHYALDVILCCNVEGTKSLQSGFLSYVAENADEELLTLVPSYNALALTFRDSETNCFAKYINSLFKGFFPCPLIHLL